MRSAAKTFMKSIEPGHVTFVHFSGLGQQLTAATSYFRWIILVRLFLQSLTIMALFLQIGSSREFGSEALLSMSLSWMCVAAAHLQARKALPPWMYHHIRLWHLPQHPEQY